jgi:hypothetical protein
VWVKGREAAAISIKAKFVKLLNEFERAPEKQWEKRCTWRQTWPQE